MAAKKPVAPLVIRVGGPEGGLGIVIGDGTPAPKSAKELQREAARTAELNRNTRVIVRGGEQVESLTDDHLKAGVRAAQEALVALLPDAPREDKSIFVDPENRILSIATGHATLNADGKFVFSVHEETTTTGRLGWKKTTTERKPGEGHITRIVIPDPQDERATGQGLLTDGTMVGYKVLVNDSLSGSHWEERHGKVEAVVADAISRRVPTAYYSEVRKPEEKSERRGLVGQSAELLIDQLQIGRSKVTDPSKLEDTRKALTQEGVTSNEGIVLVFGDGASTKIIAPLDAVDADPSLITIERVWKKWQVEGKKRVKESKEKKPKGPTPVVISAAEPAATQLGDMTYADVAAIFTGDLEILTRGIEVVPPVEPAGIWGVLRPTDKDEKKVRHTVSSDHMRTVIAKKAETQKERTAGIRSRKISVSDLVAGERFDPTEYVMGLGVARASRGSAEEIATIFNTDAEAIRAANAIVVEIASEIAGHKVRGVSGNVIATGILLDRFAPKTEAERNAVQKLADFFVAPQAEAQSESEPASGRGKRRRGKGFRVAEVEADLIPMSTIMEALLVTDPLTGQVRPLSSPDYAVEQLNSLRVPSEYHAGIISRVYSDEFMVIPHEPEADEMVAVKPATEDKKGGKSRRRRDKKDGSKATAGSSDNASAERVGYRVDGVPVTIILGDASANGSHAKNGRRS